MTVSEDGAVELAPSECRTLIAGGDFGRLAIRSSDGVDIFPVNFVMHDDALYFRSGPGSKMVDLTSDPRVAFEVDERSDTSAWSVVVHGHAMRLNSDADIEASTVLALRAWDPSDKFNYVRLEIDTITGRRVRLPERKVDRVS
ncbi:pyridoxamine 5'-phosphate oxidase family protein [Lysinimonas soli]|uniref:Pyridoxamine 5'-phosphate oxidase family protein n=1 Tax=Lysinimonas soli TaxID=1074233 RepID=A0ABW0NQB0_9MICO